MNRRAFFGALVALPGVVAAGRVIGVDVQRAGRVVSGGLATYEIGFLGELEELEFELRSVPTAPVIADEADRMCGLDWFDVIAERETFLKHEQSAAWT